MNIDVKMDMSGVIDMEKDLDYMDSLAVEYGYFEEQYHIESGLPLPLIASYQNDGVKNKEGGWHIVPRSFVDMAHDITGTELPKYNAIMQDSLCFGGKAQIDLGLNIIGNDTADSIREAIETQNFAPLKPMTIKLKNSDTILIESGQMYDDAKHKVVKGDDW